MVIQDQEQEQEQEQAKASPRSDCGPLARKIKKTPLRVCSGGGIREKGFDH